MARHTYQADTYDYPSIEPEIRDNLPGVFCFNNVYMYLVVGTLKHKLYSLHVAFHTTVKTREEPVYTLTSSEMAKPLHIHRMKYQRDNGIMTIR